MKVHADPDNLEKVKRRVEQAKIKFLDGTVVKTVDEATYLGCDLDQDGVIPESLGPSSGPPLVPPGPPRGPGS